MGSRKCGSCLSGLLIPLALWSIIVNILLYFPNGQTSYASSNKLTNYVWYFEGICFSGIMMLIVAAVLLVLESDNNCKCCQSENCSKKYMTLLSIIFSALGIAFSGYCLAISALGLVQGPYCHTPNGWEYAFEDTAGRLELFEEGQEYFQSSRYGQLSHIHCVDWRAIFK
ncbi:transmembrane 4 L6 family member 18 isoform X2 [Manis javanica]|uniref:transmembrane 4 L6 family member 18 isoform X2 n=1 Tax=Manis javanica TaxID=9974 RepID=UPI00081306C9